MDLLYLFPDAAETAPDGSIVLNWGGRDPFNAAQNLTENPAVCYPQVIPGAFSPAECAEIVRLGEARALAAATVDGRSDLASRDYRVSEIAWLPPDPDCQWFYHRMALLFLRLNQSYKFDLLGFVEPMQFTCYGQGQYFGWHIDMGHDTTSLRKLSVTVQLSPPSDYTGGQLDFHGAADMPQAREQGTAVAFPSYLAHQVSPVDQGLRRSLVAWAYGPAFR